MANFDLVPLALYEVSHEAHEKGYSLGEVLQSFRSSEKEIDSQKGLTLDQVIDVPFMLNKMAKVDNPVVPKVRAQSHDSMDSVH